MKTEPWLELSKLEDVALIKSCMVFSEKKMSERRLCVVTTTPNGNVKYLRDI